MCSFGLSISFLTDINVLWVLIHTVLNPVDKFGLEWCEGYSFLKFFSCEKNTSFASSKPISGMLGWYDYTAFNTCFFLKYFCLAK